MGKIVDVLLILISAIFSLIVAHPDNDKLEMFFIVPIFISVACSFITLTVYAKIAIQHKSLYKQERWAIIGGIMIINILVGVMTHFIKL